MIDSHANVVDALKLFHTVFGIGKTYTTTLINQGARTIKDLRSPRYSNLLPESSKKYLKYYKDLQLRIPRNEVQQHEAHIRQLLRNKKFKIDIVGSFRRGAETCGDLDVLFTTEENAYFPDTNYISIFTEALMPGHYLLETLKFGQSTMNGIIKLGDHPARRIDVFFSPPELYAFALLAKTGDTSFNKSLRTCIKEKKNNDYILSEKGIRIKVNNHYTHAVDPKDFPDVKSIFEYMDLPNRRPDQMVGYFPCIHQDVDNHSKSSRKTKRSRSSSSSSRKRKRTRASTHVSLESSADSSLTRSSIGSDRTETDPGEHYEKWKERDNYDSDDTYLTPIGSKYTSRNYKY